MTELCVDFGGSNVKVGSAARGVLGRSVEFPVSGTPADLSAVARAAADLGIEPGAVRGVVIAVPGLVDGAGRRLVEAHGKYEWMLGADLAEWAEATFRAPAVLENDARAALIGEVAAGCGRGETDAVILVLGTGIGTAAMIGGEPLRGPDGSAGILGGHLTLDWHAGACNCGNVGCAEVFGGSWALADRVRDRLTDDATGAWAARLDDPRPLGFAELIERAEAGDPTATGVLDDALLAWGVVAVSLCHAYDPHAILVAGGIARAAAVVVPPIRRHVEAHLWPSLPRPRFAISDRPEASVLRGLAALGEQRGAA